MPLYEYICRNCGKEFEKMIKFSEADLQPDCPDCQSHDTQKKISLFASVGSSSDRSYGISGSSCGTSGGFT